MQGVQVSVLMYAVKFCKFQQQRYQHPSTTNPDPFPLSV